MLAPVPERTDRDAPTPAADAGAAPVSPSVAPAEGSAARASRPTGPDEGHRAGRIYGGRFRRVVFFYSMLITLIVFWEIVLRWLLGEDFVARGRSRRWQGYARRFRRMAIDMGGVLIKLGQFISTRVDVLPPEVTRELADLQDNVPVVDFGYIKNTITRELGPLEERFLWFNQEPIAAASLGQVHRAQLHNGDRVVVKVQRPNITDIVQTDLAALGVVARFVMHFRLVRDRADVPALLDEFSRVLWEELDYRKEADNALRFNSMFADDLGIYVPGVYLEHTTHLVLTLEDVTAIKINDYAALDAARINRLDVARRLLDCYLEQIFDYGFFHADPHPGNLFVYPLPESGEAALSKNGQNGTNGANGAKNGGRNGVSKPFYLIFVDFGMTGRVTPDIMAGLRDTLIAVITQDARGMVESYQKLGVLMPGADTARLEAATRAVFDKVWGLNMNDLASLPFDEVTDVAREFSDLLLAMPFQMPQDFIYLGRTVAILSGMCTGLDPRFDPWKEIQPFVERILRQDGAKAAEGSNPLERLRGGPAGLLIDTALQTARRTFARAYRLPSLAESVLDRAERGDLVVRIDPSSELDKRVRRIERTVGHISTGILLAAVILSTTMLYLAGERTLAAIGFGVAAVLMLIYLFRGRG